MKMLVRQAIFSALIIPFILLGLWSGTAWAEVIIENPLGYDTLPDLVSAIANFLFNIALALAPVMIVIAGYFMVTSGGDAKRFQTGKNIILYTLVGFSLILLSQGLVTILKDLLSGE